MIRRMLIGLAWVMLILAGCAQGQPDPPPRLATCASLADERTAPIKAIDTDTLYRLLTRKHALLDQGYVEYTMEASHDQGHSWESGLTGRAQNNNTGECGPGFTLAWMPGQPGLLQLTIDPRSPGSGGYWHQLGLSRDGWNTVNLIQIGAADRLVHTTSGVLWLSAPLEGWTRTLSRSTDGGKTWELIELSPPLRAIEHGQRLPRLAVDEGDPARVAICAAQRPWHSLDGGVTWQEGEALQSLCTSASR